MTHSSDYRMAGTPAVMEPREAESRKRGNAASAKARGKRGARL